MRRFRCVLGVLGTAITFVVLPHAAIAQPVIMTVETGTGNDTLYMGAEGSIRFVVDPQGAEPFAYTYSLIFHFSNGNVIGLVRYRDNFLFVGACPEWFEIPEYDVLYGEATDPDTLVFGLIDFGGTDCMSTPGPVAEIRFAPLDTGTMTIDSVSAGPHYVSVLGESAGPLPIEWQPKSIVVAPCPVSVGDVQANGNLDASDIIYLVAYVFRSGPEPLPRVEAGDVDCSGTITSADVIDLVNHVFRGGAAPCGCSVGAG